MNSANGHAVRPSGPVIEWEVKVLHVGVVYDPVQGQRLYRFDGVAHPVNGWYPASPADELPIVRGHVVLSTPETAVASLALTLPGTGADAMQRAEQVLAGRLLQIAVEQLRQAFAGQISALGGDRAN